MLTQSIFAKSRTVILPEPTKQSICATGLFTNESVRAASTLQLDNGYIILKNNISQKVAELYGEDSRTYKAVKAMKKQPRTNLNAQEGRLVIMSTLGTNATQASYTTIAITTTLITALKEVSDGYISVNIDGEEKKLSKLNFTKIKDINDIANIFASKLSCEVKIVDDKIQFKTKTLGNEGSVSLSATEGIETGTNLASQTYFDVSNGVVVAGIDAVNEMSVADAINFYRDKVFFGCFTAVQDIDVDELKLINDRLVEIESDQFKLFFYNAPTKKAASEIKTKIYDTTADGAYGCLHFQASCADLAPEEALKWRSGLLAYATSQDTSLPNHEKFNMQGKTLSDIDLSSSKLDDNMAEEILDMGVHVYGKVLEQNKAMFRESENCWGPTCAVNYANIVLTLQTALASRFNTENHVDKTAEDLNGVLIMVRNILQVFADNKVFGDWNDSDEVPDVFSDKELAKDSLVNSKFAVEIPQVANINGRKVPIYVCFKLGESVVLFNLNNYVKRS